MILIRIDFCHSARLFYSGILESPSERMDKSIVYGLHIMHILCSLLKMVFSRCLHRVDPAVRYSYTRYKKKEFNFLDQGDQGNRIVFLMAKPQTSKMPP